MAATLSSPYGNTSLGVTPIKIGSARDNQLMLDDASVGAHHAEIRPEGTGYSIFDMGTYNGTYVNEQRLDPNIPRTLHNGDAIRVGNIRLNYQTGVAPSAASTQYTTPPGTLHDQPLREPIRESYREPVREPIREPVREPVRAAYEPPAYTPPRAATYAQPAPSRRGLWIALAAIAALLLLGLFAIPHGPTNTPTQAYQGYCAGINAHNGSAAYGHLTTNYQKQYPASQFNQFANTASNCTVNSVNDTTGAGVISYNYPGQGRVVADDRAKIQDNAWKIDSQIARSTPTATLNQFCSALKQGDYRTAYGLLSGALQSQVPYGQFISTRSLKVSNCAVSNVNDAAGTGTISYAFSNGQHLVADYGMANENGVWKIARQVNRP